LKRARLGFLGISMPFEKAYLDADDAVLGQYVNESACGTWEILPVAIYPGGRSALV